jgi:hypothetical protein
VGLADDAAAGAAVDGQVFPADGDGDGDRLRLQPADGPDELVDLPLVQAELAGLRLDRGDRVLKRLLGAGLGVGLLPDGVGVLQRGGDGVEDRGPVRAALGGVDVEGAAVGLHRRGQGRQGVPELDVGLRDRQVDPGQFQQLPGELFHGPAGVVGGLLLGDDRDRRRGGGLLEPLLLGDGVLDLDVGAADGAGEDPERVVGGLGVGVDAVPGRCGFLLGCGVRGEGPVDGGLRGDVAHGGVGDEAVGDPQLGGGLVGAGGFQVVRDGGPGVRGQRQRRFVDGAGVLVGFLPGFGDGLRVPDEQADQPGQRDGDQADRGAADGDVEQLRRDRRTLDRDLDRHEPGGEAGDHTGGEDGDEPGHRPHERQRHRPQRRQALRDVHRRRRELVQRGGDGRAVRDHVVDEPSEAAAGAGVLRPRREPRRQLHHADLDAGGEPGEQRRQRTQPGPQVGERLPERFQGGPGVGGEEVNEPVHAAAGHEMPDLPFEADDGIRCDVEQGLQFGDGAGEDPEAGTERGEHLRLVAGDEPVPRGGEALVGDGGPADRRRQVFGALRGEFRVVGDRLERGLGDGAEHAHRRPTGHQRNPEPTGRGGGGGEDGDERRTQRDRGRDERGHTFGDALAEVPADLLAGALPVGLTADLRVQVTTEPGRIWADLDVGGGEGGADGHG